MGVVVPIRPPAPRSLGWSSSNGIIAMQVQIIDVGPDVTRSRAELVAYLDDMRAIFAGDAGEALFALIAEGDAS